MTMSSPSFRTLIPRQLVNKKNTAQDKGEEERGKNYKSLIYVQNIPQCSIHIPYIYIYSDPPESFDLVCLSVCLSVLSVCLPGWHEQIYSARFQTKKVSTYYTGTTIAAVGTTASFTSCSPCKKRLYNWNEEISRLSQSCCGRGSSSSCNSTYRERDKFTEAFKIIFTFSELTILS